MASGVEGWAVLLGVWVRLGSELGAVSELMEALVSGKEEEEIC